MMPKKPKACSSIKISKISSIDLTRAHSEIFHGSLASQCPSREKYLEYFSKFGFLCFLRLRSVTCSQVEVPVTRGTQRFLRLISRLPHGQNFQSRKTLRKFFKIFVLSVLATCSRLNPIAKLACFAQIGQFLKPFEFPSNIL